MFWSCSGRVRWSAGPWESGEVGGTGSGGGARPDGGFRAASGDDRAVDLGGRVARRLGNAQGASVSVVCRTQRFNVGDPGVGVVARLVEQRGVGEGNADGPEQEEPGEECGAEADGEGRHEMECAGSARVRNKRRRPGHRPGQLCEWTILGGSPAKEYWPFPHFTAGLVGENTPAGFSRQSQTCRS